ncbi:hypothetical protein [Cellulophaga lytica]|uniref:hypothetical protein n=1 Tax=Cellulophaga lytica TaxID=979 RepID=UPI003CE5A53B
MASKRFPQDYTEDEKQALASGDKIFIFDAQGNKNSIIDADNLPSANGVPGDPGADGKSAYQIAVDAGFTGTEAEWLESIKGQDGSSDITPKWVNLNGDYTLTLADKGKQFLNQTGNDYEITIPANASVDFAEDFAITCIPTSTGKIKVKGATGVTIQPVQTTTADRPLSILRFGTDNYISIGIKENYTPEPDIVDLFPTGNAASAGAGEADGTSGWAAASGSAIGSVVNTDAQGGSYAISVSGATVSWRYGFINLTGLNLVPHTATIRMRRVSGTDTPCRLWTNTTNVDYTNINNAVAGATNGDWVEGTVTFTPTDSTVEMKYYSTSPSGEVDSEIEISEIIVTEN